VHKPQWEVADVLRDHGPAWRRDHALSLPSLKAISAIERCRSAALGGHILRCGECAEVQIAYNSCRNRHCPKCQGSAAKRWLSDRQADLLPVEYYHVVFTLPAIVGSIAYQNPALVYDLLFKVTAQTLRIIAADGKHLGARIGVTAVRLFRRLFLQQLIARHSQLKFYGKLEQLADGKAFAAYLDPARKTDWVVYAKRPFAGPKAVLEYLSRYTHRVAISNSRIIEYDHQTVTFKWKDYRVKGHQRFKTMQLTADEFIRRFLIHILPSGFHRIRHFGLFANHQRKVNLQLIRQRLGEDKPTEQTQETSELTEPTETTESTQQQIKPPAFVCRACGTPLVIIATLEREYAPRGPPN